MPAMSTEHARVLELAMRTPDSPLCTVLHPFLLVRAKRQHGELFVVPLVDRHDEGLARRMSVDDGVDALVITWSPTTGQRTPETARSFMYVLDERDWTRCAVQRYGVTVRDLGAIAAYEGEMQQQGVFTGIVSTLVRSDGTLTKVATKDVWPAPTLAAASPSTTPSTEMPYFVHHQDS
jgi:hypothetical protein